MIYQYRPGTSFFHRIDPLSKFVWLLCVSVAALSNDSPIHQAVLLGLVVLAGFVLAGLPPRALWRGVRLPFWFGVPYFALQLLFLPGETELMKIGALTITAEAARTALAISARLLTLVLGSFLVVATTDPRDVVLAMARQLRLPYRFAFAVAIALRFVPILEAEAETIRAAQQLRGGEPKGLLDRIERGRRFAFSVFLSAVRHVQTTAEAMENKGFGARPERTYLRTLNVPKSGIAFSVASVLLTLLFIVSLEGFA